MAQGFSQRAFHMQVSNGGFARETINFPRKGYSSIARDEDPFPTQCRHRYGQRAHCSGVGALPSGYRCPRRMMPVRGLLGSSPRKCDTVAIMNASTIRRKGARKYRLRPQCRGKALLLSCLKQSTGPLPVGRFAIQAERLRQHARAAQRGVAYVGQRHEQSSRHPRGTAGRRSRTPSPMA